MIMSDMTLLPSQYLNEIFVPLQACEHLVQILWVSFGILPSIYYVGLGRSCQNVWTVEVYGTKIFNEATLPDSVMLATLPLAPKGQWKKAL